MDALLHAGVGPASNLLVGAGYSFKLGDAINLSQCPVHDMFTAERTGAPAGAGGRSRSEAE